MCRSVNDKRITRQTISDISGSSGFGSDKRDRSDNNMVEMF